jgi:hypothetical protein
LTWDSWWSSLQNRNWCSHPLIHHQTHQLRGCSSLWSRWCLGSRSLNALYDLLAAHSRPCLSKGMLGRKGLSWLCNTLLPYDGRNEGPLTVRQLICQAYGEDGEIRFGCSLDVAGYEDQTFLKCDYSKPSKVESMEKQRVSTHLAHPI